MKQFNKEVEKVFNRYNYLTKDVLRKEYILRQPKQVLFIYFEEDFKKEDFKQPYFNPKQIISLSDGSFKFLTYCGKDQNKNINKDALVLQRLRQNIYKCYLMDSERNLRDFFIEFSRPKTIKENNYSLRVSDYTNAIRDTYTKEELIYIINKVTSKLTELSLN